MSQLLQAQEDIRHKDGKDGRLDSFRGYLSRFLRVDGCLSSLLENHRELAATMRPCWVRLAALLRLLAGQSSAFRLKTEDIFEH